MAGPVDVLAVLADYSAQHGDPEDFEQVRDAVAELIEAGNEMLRVSCSQGISDDEYWPAVQKFDAALARVQEVRS